MLGKENVYLLYHLDWNDQLTVLTLSDFPIYFSKHWLWLSLEHHAVNGNLLISFLNFSPT